MLFARRLRRVLGFVFPGLFLSPERPTAVEQAVLSVVQAVNSYLSNYILIVLLIGTGLYFTIRTKFVQFRCLGEAFRTLFAGFSLHGGEQDGGAMSSFQAVATAIAGQVGTGNIVGASGAILIGGPGAIFWMWVIAILGMATNYAEAVIAQVTRTTDESGTVHGGPVYYITAAFTGGLGRFLAGFFAVAIILALGFMGCMVQSNSIAETMNTAFGLPGWAVGVGIVVISAFIFLGGVGRLASVTEKLVPVMAVLYIGGSLAVLVANAAHVPEALGLIFRYAFDPSAQMGGVTFGLITTISQGAKRGLFSNEAGMGSTPHAHALAQAETPHKQGVLGIASVFIDTIVVVSCTALVVITVLYTGNGPLVADATGVAAGLTKTNMAQAAFGSLFGEAGGNIFVAVCLFFFAYSTVLSWNLFAKINVEYLLGAKAVPVFSIIALGFLFLGSTLSNDLVWELADLFNQLMVIPNVIALFALSNIAVKSAKTRGAEPLALEDAGK